MAKGKKTQSYAPAQGQPPAEGQPQTEGQPDPQRNPVAGSLRGLLTAVGSWREPLTRVVLAVSLVVTGIQFLTTNPAAQEVGVIALLSGAITYTVREGPKRWLWALVIAWVVTVIAPIGAIMVIPPA